MKMKHFRETRVISRNMVTDWVQGIRNLLGLRLKSYEQAIDKEMAELEEKWLTKNVQWFRFDVEQMHGGAFIITLYGVYR